MNSQQKIIWITGASSGIGESLAIEWSKYKYTLILSGRNINKLENTKSVCEKNGSEILIVPVDLTDETSVNAAFDNVQEKYSSIDILVNNGGISQRSFAIETPLNIDRELMETNFFGAVALTKLVLPLMLKNKKGSIVVISSIVGKFGFPMRTAYSASKHALQGFFESLRAEIKNDNINVLIVSPGRVQTNISLNAIDKEGKKHGIMDAGQKNGMPADVCARKIIRAVNKNKKDILIGRKEVLLVYIRKYIPALYYKIVSKTKPS